MPSAATCPTCRTMYGYPNLLIHVFTVHGLFGQAAQEWIRRVGEAITAGECGGCPP